MFRHVLSCVFEDKDYGDGDVNDKEDDGEGRNDVGSNEDDDEEDDDDDND